jgi:hypothetical protein
MTRLTIGTMMIGIAVLGLLLGLGVSTSKPSRPEQIDRVEELVNPQKVLGWDSTGLILDERKLRIPGIRAISTQSRAMKIGTIRGVEVTPEGRVIGLVRVYHRRSCGNATFINHLARIDLADMMRILGENPEFSPTGPAPSRRPVSNDDALTEDELVPIEAITNTRLRANAKALNSTDRRGSQ